MRALSDRDAVITGTGLFTPLGHGLDETWDALASGRRVSRPTARIAEPFLRATVPEVLESQSKFLNGSGRLAAEVVALAVADARLATAGHEPTSKGFYLAALDLTLADFTAYHESFRDATDGFSHPAVAERINTITQRKMNPFYLLDTLNNNAFSFVSVWHGLHGANTSISGWGASGATVVSLAARAVSRGDASAAVACGTGRGIGAVAMLEFDRLRLLPDGVVPGEGAGAVVLEPLGDARTRRAAVHAAVVGSCAMSGMGDRLPWAVRAAVDAACEEAGLARADVGSVWGSDAARAALEHAGPVAIQFTDTRRPTGDMSAGSELADVVLAAASLARGTLPDGKHAGSSAIVVATGLDGQAVALVLARTT